ncbi:MAG: MliC family protein [Bacteroidia bacterium]|nr:MliC family protein [Bacteroidia bacterium]
MKKFTFILAATVLLFAAACNNSKKNQDNSEAIATTITNSNGESIDVTYNTAEETATIVFDGETVVLQQQPSASGTYYANDTYEYTEWQDEVELKKNGKVVFSSKEEEPGMTNNFVDGEGNALIVAYKTTGEVPMATITYKDIQEIALAQIPESAGAKGAEYENEAMKIKWITSEDGGKLTIDGKTINFKTQL